MRKTSQGRKASTDAKPELMSIDQMVKQENIDGKTFVKEEK